MKGIFQPDTAETYGVYKKMMAVGTVLLAISVAGYAVGLGPVVLICSAIGNVILVAISVYMILYYRSIPDLGPEDQVITFRYRLADEGQTMYMESIDDPEQGS